MKIDYNVFNALNVGRTCKFFRGMRLGKTQAQVAKELRVSREVVNRFENGTFNSYKILFYYIGHGLLDMVPLDHWDFYDTSLPPEE